MKKRLIFIVLALCLVFTGCSKAPSKAIDGLDWDKDWTTVGSLLGVEPRDGWTLQRSEDVLAAEGMYYYVWAKGEAITYTNEFEETVTSYPEEIHLILLEAPSEEQAASSLASWNELTEERYPDAAKSQATYAGQAFDLSSYDLGISASAQRGEYAIRIDIMAQDGAEPEPILADFLNQIHYAK